jgi:Holliday junction resolvase RusA-like endonuclease
MQSIDMHLPLAPKSKARPRTYMGQARPYMEAAYKDWIKKARALMGEHWTLPPLDHINCLVVTFYGPARGDLDNRLGALLDAGNGLIWADDNVKVIGTVAMKWRKSSLKDAHINFTVIWQ